MVSGGGVGIRGILLGLLDLKVFVPPRSCVSVWIGAKIPE